MTRSLALVFLVGCGGGGEAKPTKAATVAAGAWHDIAPPTGYTRDWFVDRDGFWRCTDDTCTRFSQARTPPATLTLSPCPGSRTLASSPDGTWIATLCKNTEIVATRVADRHEWRRTSPFDAHSLVVDDKGVVTLAGDDGNVARISESTQIQHTLAVPPSEITKSEPSDLAPANGRWLAYSDGAYYNEVAWLADGARAIKLGGGAMINRDHLWISKMSGGYVELTPAGERVLRGGPKGAVVGHGMIMGEGPWGTRGYFVQYETIALLFDTDFSERLRVPLPKSDKLSAGTMSIDPSGARAYFLMHSGAVKVWDPPLKP